MSGPGGGRLLLKAIVTCGEDFAERLPFHSEHGFGSGFILEDAVEQADFPSALGPRGDLVGAPVLDGWIARHHVGSVGVERELFRPVERLAVRAAGRQLTRGSPGAFQNLGRPGQDEKQKNEQSHKHGDLFETQSVLALDRRSSGRRNPGNRARPMRPSRSPAGSDVPSFPPRVAGTAKGRENNLY